MEKFWAVILIFAIVAAGGLLYVNQVYAPQKEAQVAMADTANQTLTAVKMEMDNDETPSFVSGAKVIEEVEDYCDRPGNTVAITVISGGQSKTYTNGSGDVETHVGNPAKMFIRTPDVDDGDLVSIVFEEH